jgi:predicted enzyme related to lactoylglutathione lyase
MHRINRRNLLRAGVTLMATAWAAIIQAGCSSNRDRRTERESPADRSAVEGKNTEKANTMQIHYLEIVTPDVNASVALYSKIHDVSFGPAEESLGGARVAKLANGGTLGVRAPLRPTERPVVRPYFLVHDIDKAVVAATQSGVEIAMQPTEIPGRGKFAILIQGGIESGLWQV